MSDCKNRETNLHNCNCTYNPCPRKGICCECISYHRDSGELPACFFTKEIEGTFDRSVRRFIAMRS
jgi:hypothetical protein